MSPHFLKHLHVSQNQILSNDCIVLVMILLFLHRHTLHFQTIQESLHSWSESKTAKINISNLISSEFFNETFGLFVQGRCQNDFGLLIPIDRLHGQSAYLLQGSFGNTCQQSRKHSVLVSFLSERAVIQKLACTGKRGNSNTFDVVRFIPRSLVHQLTGLISRAVRQ